MTGEEIKNTPKIVDYVLSESLMAESKEKLHKRLDEICNLAIKALEQETKTDGDCISRQAAIDAVHQEFDECIVWDESGKYTADEVERVLDSVPPVNPQETKTEGKDTDVPTKPKAEKVIGMREANPEERESIDKYIKSISKSTGVDFWDLKQESQTDKALNLLAKWAVECGFGYDSIPEQYEKYKDDIAEMGYVEGLVYIAKAESEEEVKASIDAEVEGLIDAEVEGLIDAEYSNCQ